VSVEKMKMRSREKVKANIGFVDKTKAKYLRLAEVVVKKLELKVLGVKREAMMSNILNFTVIPKKLSMNEYKVKD
jgi:hypothetical protein